LWLADLAAEVEASGSAYRVVTSAGDVLVSGNAPTGGDFAPSDWFVVPEGESSLLLESVGRAVTRGGERRVLGLALGAVEQWGRPLRSVLRRAARLLLEWPRRLVVERGLTDYGGIYRSYDEVTANSRYTAHWLRRWWGVEAEVIEPPVIASTQSAMSESPLILSIGRFFAGGHNKKHDVMVRAFRRLVERGLTGWRLALVGGLGQQAADRSYLQAVRRAAADLPIDLYVDADEALVADLRGRAALCWHAAGYGESPTRHPERYEHFGMAVAELMGAGVVPIVLDGGGLREIVQHGRTGLRWRTLDELAQYTLRLARDARLRRRLAGAGRQRAARWSLETYQRRVVDLAERAYARRAEPRGTSSSRSAPA
jgi:glycosyltransferase involved in cell wall biosynthesis